jgi:hypothetical protein
MAGVEVGVYDGMTDQEIEKANGQFSPGFPPDNKVVRIDGKVLLIDKTYSMAPSFQKKVVLNNPADVVWIKNPSLEVQEWICKNRPDLINQISNLDPELEAKHSHEIELGNVDL